MESSRKKAFSIIELIVVLVFVGVLVAFLLPAVRTAGPAVRRTQCRNNLKQIALAMLNYEETYHALPPAYTVDAHGKRLHSWRTLILPYVEGAALYKKIDLTKAWDDPANAEAFKTKVSIYSCPSTDCPHNRTTYLAVVAPNSSILSTRPRPLSEITGERGKKLMVIEVDCEHAVDWMNPVAADENLVLSFGPKTALPHEGGMNAAFVDGTVQFLSADTPTAERRAIISATGKDK